MLRCVFRFSQPGVPSRGAGLRSRCQRRAGPLRAWRGEPPSASCGPRSSTWADDGDTVKARILREESGPPERVRLTGIQAPEPFNYSRKSRVGACLGVEATETLENLGTTAPAGWSPRRRAAARSANARAASPLDSDQARGQVDRPGGSRSSRRGLALWFPNGQEWAWNGTYARLAEEAAAKGHRHLEPGGLRQARAVGDQPPQHQAEVGRREQGPRERRVDPDHEPRPRERRAAGRLEHPRLAPPRRQAQAGLQVPLERRDPAGRLDRGERRPGRGRRRPSSTGASRRRRRSSRTAQTTRSRPATAPTSSTRTASCARTRSTPAGRSVRAARRQGQRDSALPRPRARVGDDHEHLG